MKGSLESTTVSYRVSVALGVLLGVAALVLIVGWAAEVTDLDVENGQYAFSQMTPTGKVEVLAADSLTLFFGKLYPREKCTSWELPRGVEATLVVGYRCGSNTNAEKLLFVSQKGRWMLLSKRVSYSVPVLDDYDNLTWVRYSSASAMISHYGQFFGITPGTPVVIKMPAGEVGKIHFSASGNIVSIPATRYHTDWLLGQTEPILSHFSSHPTAF